MYAVFLVIKGVVKTFEFTLPINQRLVRGGRHTRPIFQFFGALPPTAISNIRPQGALNYILVSFPLQTYKIAS